MRSFITLLAVIASILLVLFYAWPAWQSFQSLRSQTADLQNASSELDNLLQTHDSLVTQINSISPNDLNLINQAVPQGVSKKSLIVTLETLANQNSLILKQIEISLPQSNQTGGVSQPAAPVASATQAPAQNVPVPTTQVQATTPASTQTGINELDVTFSVTGTYQNFRKFLNDIEKSIRLIDINSI